MRGLLVVVASLAEEHRLQGVRASVAVACWLWSTGSIIMAHGLGSSEERGIFPDEGGNLCLLRWWVGSLPLSRQGSWAVTICRDEMINGGLV